MPVTHITITWPDNETDQVYSPSSVIHNYFTAGESLEPDAFLATCEAALTKASDRVREKFGFACSSAEAELDRIREKCKTYTTTKPIKIIALN